jgi:hypothetical protein
MAIPVKTFILFTTVTLREEEMMIHTPPHVYAIFGLLAFMFLLNGAPDIV